MAFLLDTCIVSEFTQKQPDRNVVEWLQLQPPETLFISTITTGEIRRGIERLPTSKRRIEIEIWFDALKRRYDKRILSFDLAASETWGRLKAQTERDGRPRPDTDMQIAATAFDHGHIIATRNVKDFHAAGVLIFNPWTFHS